MGWRGETKEIIRRYPQHCRDEAALKTVSITASLSGRGGRSVSRTTETVALRQLPDDEQKELDAVRMAISTTMRYRNGRHRLKLIDMMYWRRYGRSMRSAASEVPCSYDTASEWHRAFIELTDAYMRII